MMKFSGRPAAANKRLAALVATTALGGVLAMAGEAQAQYRIGANADASVDAGGAGARYSYNYNGLDQYPGVGSANVLAPCQTTAYQGCTVSGAGPTTASGALTSTAVSAYANLHGVDQLFGYPISITATAAANASLARGSIGVAASGTYWPNANQGVGSGQAVIQDTLDFSVAGAGADTVTDIGVKFAVDGSMGLTNYAQGAQAELQSTLVFGNASYSSLICAGCGSPDPVVESARASGWVSDQISADGMDFSGVYAVTGPNAVVGFEAFMTTVCQGGAACDYDHTGQTSLSLPTGVTYTSSSGVFLTQAGGVPEPATWAMLILGCGLVGLALRRRSAAVAA
jgi:hypothetical protein